MHLEKVVNHPYSTVSVKNIKKVQFILINIFRGIYFVSNNWTQRPTYIDSTPS